MIRKITEKDYITVCSIVNSNWKSVYKDYVNPYQLSEEGCVERKKRLIKDFTEGRLYEYVVEEQGEITAMMSMGDTADKDKQGAFEIWRIYVSECHKGKGTGGSLIEFAESFASQKGYDEIVIWAFKENSRALKFYQSHGYSIDSEKDLGFPYNAVGVRLHKYISYSQN